MANMTDAAGDSWSDIIPTAIRVPLAAYKHRHKIHEWWTKLVVAWGTGDTRIVVTGRSFSGKTLLTGRMKMGPEILELHLPPPSPDVETEVLKVGEWAKIVRVIPGQDIQERERGLHEAFSIHQNLEGVIHVVDWGFTRDRDAAIRKDQIERNGYDSVPKIRDFNTKQEIREFKAVCGLVRGSSARCGRPRWLLIAANKADLYIDKLVEAQRYYHPGLTSAFTAPLHDLFKNIGKDHLGCDAVPVSSLDEDFEWNGEVVPSRVGGTLASRALMRNFIQALANLSEGQG